MAFQTRRGNNADWETYKGNIIAGEPATVLDTERFLVGVNTGDAMELTNIDVIAPEFTENQPYAENDTVVYQGRLYRCNTANTGTWNAAYWDAVTVVEAGADSSAVEELQENALIKRTASGSIASFSDGSDMPMDSLIADINPVQSGSGDPSPTNVRPISGWDSVDVNVVGKNLFGLNVSDYADAEVFGLSSYKAIAVPNGTYTISTDAPTGYIWGGETVDVSAYTRIFLGASKTVTVTNGQLYLGILTSDKTTALSYHTQIEKGTTATSYSPYNGNTTTVDLGQTVYGGSLNVTTGVLTVDSGMQVYDGSSDENWVIYSTHGFRIANAAMGTQSWADGLCDVAPTLRNNHNSYGVSFGASNSYIYFARSMTEWGVSDVSGLRTWLASNPITVVYPLATPTTVTLTPTQVNTLLGQNNVWADSGDVEVTYKANASLTIEEIINAITSLGGNV